MKVKSLFVVLVVVTLLTSVTFAADDGPMFGRNLSRTPETMTGAAQISVMPLYVPAQNTLGEPVVIEYYAGDCTNSDTSGCAMVNTMDYAKPLFATYNDGIELEAGGSAGDSGIMTGAGFGERDSFAALSLDDGATWKNFNLSDSAARSSFVLRNGHEYPGDVFKVMHNVSSNRVAVAWISRFCESGAPLYSWTPEDQLLLASTYGLGANLTVDGVEYNTYASDLFGVAGTQKSVDYTEQGFPEVGEIPYGCVWAARGTLEEVDADGNLSPGSGVYDIIWRASERLTSGRRDANRIEITGTPGAGFIISWQEDPEGLRPGKGLGPGEGWSGAIANSKTDIWYTYIAWDHFDDVCLDDAAVCAAGPLAGYTGDTKPKVAVPYAVPMRLTDNNLCKADVDPTNDGYLPYCYADFNGNGTADLCATSLSWTNPGGTTLNVCQAEDGRVLTGRTASMRVRWAMKPYDQDSDGAPDSAWVLLGEEKMKALGSELGDDLDPIDIGKNMWYHTFDMFNPELVQQGLMLNSPAIDHETGAFFPIYVDEWGNEIYETEIARRFNLMVQGIGAAMVSPNRTSAILIYKEGILNQGGPADIFIRRVVLPEGFDPAVDNPFAYENVECMQIDDAGVGTPAALLYPDGSNPNYVRGLCPAQGMNLSATTIVSCDNGSGGETCAADFPWEDGEQDDYPKVTEWIQAEDNFNDPSWVNPYDVSKGHRGFIDGDFVMMMYATAPNWKANTVGNESYNLYIRRSFDGGQTWTTLPASYTHIDGSAWTGDGTTSCEWYGWGGTSEYEVCTDYGPGAFEQARNVSQLTGTRITVLDPRYSPTGGMLKEDYRNLLCYDGTDWVNCGYTEAPYDDENRDPSGHFVTYETGDNTVVTEETGTVPMDMFYSRAFNFGDDYDVVDFTTTSGQLVQRWDWLENGDELATEASVMANPLGSKFYAVWNQELEVQPDVYTDMDAQFRRIFYNFNSDTIPTGLIGYTDPPRGGSYTLGGDVTFVGIARDTDRLGEGIVEFRWYSDLQGELGTDQTLTIPITDLVLGVHTISFTARDGEGNWSSVKTIHYMVAEQLYESFLPKVSHR